MAAACLYGIIEDYVQLGERTGKGAVPSHAKLATTMGCSVRSVIRYLTVLRDHGWIEWEGEDGKASRYVLPNLRQNDTGNLRQIGRPPTPNCHTTSAKLADDLEQGNNREELTPPPTPPAGESVSPYGVFAAICEADGQDPAAYSARERGKLLAVCKRLVEDGTTSDEVRAFVAWIRSQTWRTTPVTPFTVEKEIGAWRAKGRPDGAATGRATSSRTADGRLKVM